MIIFYDKNTGKIVGTIDGRVHPKEHLNMWIGDKKENGRLVIQWKPTGKERIDIIEEPIFKDVVNREGFWETKQVGIKKRKEKTIEYGPEFDPDGIITDIDSGKKNIYDYKIKLKDGKVIGFTKKL